MPTNNNRLSNFWQEIRRRNVLRSLAVYAGTAFIILEAADIIFPRMGLPDWSINLVLYLLILGAVINLVVSWIYDFTPKGVQKTKPSGEIREGEIPVTPNSWKIATYVSIVVIIGLILFNIIGGTRQLRTGDIQSLVILPFDNYTGDEDLEYFVSGMHASLIGDMGQLGGLQVKSRTSSNAFKDMDMTIPEIASELGADAALETAVMCLGDTICIQLRLVSTTGDEEQLWIGEYKEEKSQILNLYNRITRQIANEVLVELTPDEERLLARTRTVDTDAYDAFLKGHQYWDDLSEESLNKALEYLTIAVESDPEWAPPYSGLAKVWVGLAQMGYESPEVAGPMIFENINKAMELDPDLPDLHFTIGIIAVWTEWNWDKGEKEFLQALAINPNDAMSRIYYAHLLTILQRSDEAVTQGQLAVDLDPLNSLIHALYAEVLADIGDWQAALDQIDEALTIDPENFFAYGFQDVVAYHLHDYNRAFKALKVLLPSMLIEDNIINDIERIFNEQGIESAYEAVFHPMEMGAQDGNIAPFDISMRYNLMNQPEKTMDWIEKGFEIHDPNTPYIGTGLMASDQLRTNPRYIDVLEKMNLPFPKD